MSDSRLPEPPMPSVMLADADLPPENAERRRWVQDILPFATSLTLHAGLIILGYATYRAAATIIHPISRAQITPAEIMPGIDDHPGVTNPGTTTDADRRAAQLLDISVIRSHGNAEQQSRLNRTLMDTSGGGAGTEVADLIGSGAAGGIGRGESGGNGDGTGLGAGGDIAPFGTPGGIPGNTQTIFTPAPNAHRVVYICDASGSMMEKMDLLKEQLQNSVEKLPPYVEFDVIFFQDGLGKDNHYLELSSDLIRAVPDNKTKLAGFLQDVVGRGTTHVIPALNAAFHMQTKPQMIYLLTDGAFEDEGGEAVAHQIKELNADGKVRINTILLLGKDDVGDGIKDATQTMKKIAGDNGGELNTVSVEDLVDVKK